MSKTLAPEHFGCKPDQLKSTLKAGEKILGFDLGTKTIGLALSDGLLSMAHPLETLPRTKFSKDMLKIRDIVETHTVGAFVFGWPLNMDGSEGAKCQSVKDFALNLIRQEGFEHMPVLFQDERMSTQAVERTLIGEADLSRAKRKDVIDRAAAAYILQGVLDKMG